ncbi:MAG: hypothetical protein NTU86_07955 [Burkholderiales bacterium]|nr:hypothetical protein [Burkholderiales bacterium]
MQRPVCALVVSVLLALVAPQAFGWGNHSLAAYRAFEKMPEVASAGSIAAEPLESFLRSEEKTLEALLASQEAWAQANLEKFPVRPTALAFKADPARSDEARRLAFLMALRIAPNSRFALYYQPDPQLSLPASANLLPHASVNTLPEAGNASQRYLALKPGEPIAPLSVLASACDEPDYGLDINLWEDSPSDWGKVYGFGTQPFGNPALSFSSQAPFHMGFMHESRIVYLAAPFIKRTFPLLRVHQYTSLAELAFRTGHPYWGWRFAGLSLHYLQDLTQPYHASLAPGESTLKLLGVNALAMAGMPSKKEDMVILLSNRHLALEKYQTELLHNAAQRKQETSIEVALHAIDRDRAYPEWNDRYLRDAVAAQAAQAGSRLVEVLLSTLPGNYVNDPGFDFGVKEGEISLVAELAKRDAADRAKLDAIIAELMGNFAAHSRNAMRGILKAGGL